ncbi:MAG: hypothetical protein HQM01_03780 [Magnetococcales bacterium]|nr:hypothetical protein [Magnetococcales bacterium]
MHGFEKQWVMQPDCRGIPTSGLSKFQMRALFLSANWILCLQSLAESGAASPPFFRGGFLVRVCYKVADFPVTSCSRELIIHKIQSMPSGLDGLAEKFSVQATLAFMGGGGVRERNGMGVMRGFIGEIAISSNCWDVVDILRFIA